MAESIEFADREPTPEAAASELHNILTRLPSFEPCRGAPEQWQVNVRHRRFPVWDLWPLRWRETVSAKPREIWAAYGRGFLVLWIPKSSSILKCDVSESPCSPTQLQEAIQRVLAAPAASVPTDVRAELHARWRSVATKDAGPEPELIVRNDWHERRLFIAKELPHVLVLADLALRAIHRVDGNVHAIDALKKDDLLHDETRDSAIAALRKVPGVEAAQSTIEQGSPSPKKLPPSDPVLIQMEKERLKLKRKEVAEATSSRDVDRLFQLWESTTDILFRTNREAAASRPEEQFHLGRIVFALAAVAHDAAHPHTAMNTLSELLNRVMPLEWFDNPQDKKGVAEAVDRAGDEIRDLYFHRDRGKDQPKGDVPPLASPPDATPAATPPVAQAQALHGEVVNVHDLIQHKVAARLLGKKAPELSDWLRKVKDSDWVHPAWKGSKERFHYLLEQFPGGTLLRSRIVELQVWLKDLSGRSPAKRRTRTSK